MARRTPAKFAERMAELEATHLSDDGKIWQAPPKEIGREPAGKNKQPGAPIFLDYNPISLISEPGDFGKALEAIRTEPELPAFELAEGLCLACQDHIADLYENGGTSAMGSDASNFRERAGRYGKPSSDLHQILVTGHDAPFVIAAWVAWNNSMKKKVDRFALFNPGLSQVGVAFGAHPEWGAMTVILLATDYQSDPQLMAKRLPERANIYQDAATTGYQTVRSRRGRGKGCCVIC